MRRYPALSLLVNVNERAVRPLVFGDLPSLNHAVDNDLHKLRHRLDRHYVVIDAFGSIPEAVLVLGAEGELRAFVLAPIGIQSLSAQPLYVVEARVNGHLYDALNLAHLDIR